MQDMSSTESNFYEPSSIPYIIEFDQVSCQNIVILLKDYHCKYFKWQEYIIFFTSFKG